MSPPPDAPRRTLRRGRSPGSRRRAPGEIHGWLFAVAGVAIAAGSGRGGAPRRRRRGRQRPTRAPATPNPLWQPSFRLTSPGSPSPTRRSGVSTRRRRLWTGSSGSSGGSDSSRPARPRRCYDPATDNWTTGPGLPAAVAPLDGRDLQGRGRRHRRLRAGRGADLGPVRPRVCAARRCVGPAAQAQPCSRRGRPPRWWATRSSSSGARRTASWSRRPRSSTASAGPTWRTCPRRVSIWALPPTAVTCTPSGDARCRPTRTRATLGALRPGGGQLDQAGRHAEANGQRRGDLCQRTCGRDRRGVHHQRLGRRPGV